MVTTNIKINNVKLSITQKEELYEIEAKGKFYSIEAPQEGIDLLNELLKIVKKIKNKKNYQIF